METPLIVKVAAKSDKKKELKTVGAASGAMVLGKMPAQIIHQQMAAPVAKKLMGDYSVTKKFAPGSDDIIGHMIKKHDLKGVKLFLGDKAAPLASSRGPYFLPSDPIIKRLKGIMGSKGVHAHGVKDPGIIAHELGHAVDFKRFGKAKQIMRAAGPLAGGAGAIYLLRDEEKAKYAPLAAAAGTAPILWQEGKASRIGMKAIKEVLGSGAARKSSKVLRKAFGTYLGLPLAAAGGAYIASKILHGTNNK